MARSWIGKFGRISAWFDENWWFFINNTILCQSYFLLLIPYILDHCAAVTGEAPAIFSASSSRMPSPSSTAWLTTIYGFAPQTTAFSHDILARRGMRHSQSNGWLPRRGGGAATRPRRQHYHYSVSTLAVLHPYAVYLTISKLILEICSRWQFMTSKIR